MLTKCLLGLACSHGSPADATIKFTERAWKCCVAAHVGSKAEWPSFEVPTTPTLSDIVQLYLWPDKRVPGGW